MTRAPPSRVLACGRPFAASDGGDEAVSTSSQPPRLFSRLVAHHDVACERVVTLGETAEPATSTTRGPCLQRDHRDTRTTCLERRVSSQPGGGLPRAGTTALEHCRARVDRVREWSGSSARRRALGPTTPPRLGEPADARACRGRSSHDDDVLPSCATSRRVSSDPHRAKARPIRPVPRWRRTAILARSRSGRRRRDRRVRPALAIDSHDLIRDDPDHRAARRPGMAKWLNNGSDPGRVLTHSGTSVRGISSTGFRARTSSDEGSRSSGRKVAVSGRDCAGSGGRSRRRVEEAWSPRPPARRLRQQRCAPSS